MKKASIWISVVLAALMALAFVGCGKKASQPPADTTQGRKALVVYFSVNDDTAKVADTIASATGADTFEIKAKEAYKDEDVDFTKQDSRAAKEQADDKARPEIDGEVKEWDSYDTIFVGYPIWKNKAPKILDTFMETYDFTDKTVVPFATSADGADIGETAKELQTAAGDKGTWLDGKVLDANVTEEDITAWMTELGLDLGTAAPVDATDVSDEAESETSALSEAESTTAA